MLAQIFGSFLQIFNFLFGALEHIWNSVDVYTKYVFLGVFTLIVVSRFFLIPILGGQVITLPSAVNTTSTVESTTDSMVTTDEFFKDGAPPVRTVVVRHGTSRVKSRRILD